MQQLTLYNGNKNNYISVSMDFIDNFVCDAPGEFVKVYLYLLRCMETSSSTISISDIADRFNYTEKDVLRALSYWEKKSLLSLDYDHNHDLCGIHFQDTSLKRASSLSPIREFPSVDKPAETTKPSGSRIPRQRMEELSNEPEVRQILFIASQYLGKTLNSSETEILLHIFDDFGFSPDLIEYLIESSVEKNQKSLHSMEKTAAQWYENGITTVAQADGASQSVNQSSLAVMNAFGISGRLLAQSETEYVQKWLNTYHFSLELVINACNRTIQAIGVPSFRYANTILSNWHKMQVHTLEDVQALDAAHQTRQNKAKSTDTAAPRARKVTVKGNNFPQRAYDYDSLEQQLLNVN